MIFVDASFFVALLSARDQHARAQKAFEAFEGRRLRDLFLTTNTMADATASLSDYARKARKETLIVTRRGKPVAALMPVDAHTDLENLVVTTHPTFQAIMERSEARYEAEGGLSTDQVRARLAERRMAGRKAG